MQTDHDFANADLAGLRPNGLLATYAEDAWRLRVQVLDDQSDTTFERFTLRVVARLGGGRLPANLAVGATFLYQRRRGVFCCGLALLTWD